MGCTASRKKTMKRRRRKKPADTQSCAIRTMHLMLWNIREAFHYFAVSPPHSLFGDKTYFLSTWKVRLLLLLLLQALAVKHFCDDGGWRLTTIKDQSAISICWPLGPQAYICQEQPQQRHTAGSKAHYQRNPFSKAQLGRFPPIARYKNFFLCSEAACRKLYNRGQKEGEWTLTSPRDTISSLHTLVINVSSFGKRGWDSSTIR